MGEIAQVHLPERVPEARGSDRQLQNEEAGIAKTRGSSRTGDFRVALRHQFFPPRGDPALAALACGNAICPAERDGATRCPLEPGSYSEAEHVVKHGTAPPAACWTSSELLDPRMIRLNRRMQAS